MYGSQGYKNVEKKIPRQIQNPQINKEQNNQPKTKNT